jgi:hypothetical protein
MTRHARPEGFEPSTYGLEIRCSIQLSYGRFLALRGQLPRSYPDNPAGAK